MAEFKALILVCGSEERKTASGSKMQTRTTCKLHAALAVPAVLVLALAWPFLGRAEPARSYQTVLSLGDSLSDTGNNPPTGDYYEGRWSNGPLWNEYLTEDFGGSLVNVAYSGSETSDLPGQADEAGEYALDYNNTLCTVWSGANDFINGVTNGFNAEAWERIAVRASSNVVRGIEVLYTKGARNFLVVNLPDLSKTPAARGLPASFKNLVRNNIVLFNDELDDRLASFRRMNQKAQVARLDAFSLLDAVLVDPEAYGFTQVTSDALDAFVNPAFDGPATNYVFWDEIHPATKAHEWLSVWANEALAASPPQITGEPASAQVVAGGTAVFSVQAYGATSYKWHFHGQAIKGATNQTYTIASARPGNAGDYWVVVRNKYGSTLSSNAMLTVVMPPMILKEPASQEVGTNGTARFRVLAAGTAPLYYQWLLNALPLPSATNAVLTLVDAQIHQAGNYSVVVTNLGGSVTSSNAVLTVQGGAGE